MKYIRRPILYSLAVTLLCGSLVTSYLIKKNSIDEPVINPVLEKVIPVIKEDLSLIKPYVKEDVEILSNYYDYNDSADNQIQSIIFYDNTFMQNTGIIYGADDEFDVNAITDGKVTKVTYDDITSYTVEVTHKDNLISRYQFLSSIDVSEGADIKKGAKIGVSGISNLIDNSKNQLYFSLLYNGEYVNALNYYGKTLEEL